MCGIVGFFQPNVSVISDIPKIIGDMLSKIQHRGPDAEGIWFDEEARLALGHRRLSILDLTSAGNQPMESSCGRFIIVFNGEIYNHLELRSRLEKLHQIPKGGWRGHSDTETLLACISFWGIQAALQSTVGMFALAIWDKKKKSLALARDRIGEKPLYYGWQNGALLFASELKALQAHPAFEDQIDWHVANTFLRLNYIPAPSSIYRGIFKLKPGTILEFNQLDIQSKQLPMPFTYWSLESAVDRGLHKPFLGSFLEAVEELEGLVRNSVHMQSSADVPIGAFLSGGIDSSTVVAMMKSLSSTNVTTFSIGMPDPRIDESKEAAAVAKYLGTNHVEHTIQPQEAIDLIPDLSQIWDEPFADSSQIPTYLVSKLAKQKVAVALSGDGGDEFFLGYPHYTLYQKIWKTRILGKLPWDTAIAMISPFAGNQKVDSILRRSESIINAWRQPDSLALHRYWIDQYRHERSHFKERKMAEISSLSILADAASTAGLWDAGTYLPDDILVKVDRASMANSLETRAPLLDHRIIEFAYSIPIQYKINNGISKKVLREVLYRHVPKKIVDRPKMGFSIPLSSWLRKELRPWAESLLEQIPKNSEYLNKHMINQLWKEHLSGQRNHSERLWSIFSLLGFIKNLP